MKNVCLSAHYSGKDLTTEIITIYMLFKTPSSLTHPHHLEKQIRPSQKTSRADPSSTGSGGQVTGDARKGEREGVKGERGGGAEEEGEGAGGVVEACAGAESAVWGGPEDDFVCVF